MLAFHHIPSAVVAVFISFNSASENRSTPSAPTGFDVSAAVDAKFAGLQTASMPELVQTLSATIRIGANSWFAPKPYEHIHPIEITSVTITSRKA